MLFLIVSVACGLAFLVWISLAVENRLEEYRQTALGQTSALKARESAGKWTQSAKGNRKSADILQ